MQDTVWTITLIPCKRVSMIQKNGAPRLPMMIEDPSKTLFQMLVTGIMPTLNLLRKMNMMKNSRRSNL